MKNLSKVLALVLVIAMVFSIAVSAGAAASFKDDADINYDEAVQLLTALDVLNGYDTDGDGEGDTFLPGKAITRAEVAVMISYLVANSDSEYGLYNDINKLNNDYKSLCTFADSKNHWAAGFIAFCAGNKYISGRDANTFDPDATITVAETAVILLRVLGYNATTEGFGTTANTVGGYNTQLTAQNAGLLNDVSASFFAPATREVVAQLVMNALDAYTVGYYANGTRYYNVFTYTVNGDTFDAYEQLVNVCFQHVLKVNTTSEYGYAGHQWVTYPNVTVQTNTLTGAQVVVYTGAAGKLTDVVVDDTAVASFVGGTAYSKVAATLGLTSATSTVPVQVYVNGALLNANGVTASGADFSDRLPGAGTTQITTNYTVGSLNAIYAAGVAKASLPDNCALTVVRDYDRSVGGTYYKLMYNFEFVATIDLVGQVTNALSTRYGQYQYEVNFYKNTAVYTDYVYAATKDAYAANTYYLVVPNESTATSGSTYPNVAEYNTFLSINVANVVGPFTATSGSSAVFANNYYISDGTTTYYVSANIADFITTKAAYKQPMGIVLNTAGYAAAYLPVRGTALETGYVYVDSVEFSETVTAGASWLTQYDRTWSAQSKAQVYFPAIGGNSNYTVIDLAIYKNAGAYYVDIATANAAEFIDLAGDFVADGYVTAGAIALKGEQTNAFWDYYGAVNGEYAWTNNNSNIRVYDEWFDGWYAYTKNSDGTYSLEPVGSDYVEITKGNANVKELTVGNEYYGSTHNLTSTTEVYSYSMNLSTMTATATLQTAYTGITGGKYGGVKHEGNGVAGHLYTMPYVGQIGGEIVLNSKNNTITTVNDFETVYSVNPLNYALYKGTYGYTTANGTGMKFLMGGSAQVLYPSPYGVYFTDTEGNTTFYSSNKNAPGYAGSLSDLVDYMELLDTKRPGAFAFELSVTDGYITEIVVHNLVKLEKINLVDNANYIRPANPELNSMATNFNTAAVWNYNTGAADVVAKGDTVYFVLKDNDIAIDETSDQIVAMWVETPNAVNDGTPSWNVPSDWNTNNPFQWWTNQFF